MGSEDNQYYQRFAGRRQEVLVYTKYRVSENVALKTILLYQYPIVACLL